MFAALLLAALLPAHLQPAAPFPRILTDAPTIEPVSPGVDYGTYDLLTDAGPIVVHAIAVQAHAPNVRLDTVLAGDALTSGGETISSMARRTDAIAGINSDYFDIGNTNAPTNIVVRSNRLMRTPRKRYALVITADGLPQIVETSFTGMVTVASHTVSLDAINVFPPPGGGTSLITPAFGPVPPRENLTLVGLTPAGGTRPLGSYTVTDVLDNTQRQSPGYYLAIGINAYGSAGVPNPGARVVASGDLAPVPLADVTAAVGGGPLLLDGGAWVDDPDGPSGPQFALRIPSSGAAIGPNGTLYLIEVDGRQPEESVGVTRPQFAALMRAFGAIRGMAFDGGGSSEIVARTPAQTQADLQNAPSDGHERKVADGIFVYDTATRGPADQLAAAPQSIHAFPGGTVPVKVALEDAADHVVGTPPSVDARVVPADLGTMHDGAFVASQAGDGSIVLRSGAFSRSIPVQIVADPARVTILPGDPSVQTGGDLHLRARAFDAQGYALALPPDLPWRALGATIDTRGNLHVGSRDALVSLLLGDHVVSAQVVVGFHDVPIDASAAHFFTVPRGGEGAVTADVPCATCMQLQYALGPGERAAYLMLETPLPAHSVAVAFDVLDDGSGALLKVALRNTINEDVLLIAGRLDRPGWRSVEVRLPATLAQPAKLTGIYVIGPSGAATISGSIAVRNLHVVAAGAPDGRQ